MAAPTSVLNSRVLLMSEGFTYPETRDFTGDLYDLAYRWGWETPAFRDLVYACYKTPDLPGNARRFFESEEFGAALDVLRELGRPPDRNTRVLDFGCGNGIASYALARSGYAVTGVDSSRGEIAGVRAAEQVRSLDGADFQVRQTNGERLPFADESFDLIWMREALHHVKDLPGFLGEARRLLRPGGLLCALREVVIWNEEQRADFFATHPFYPITKDEGCYYLREYQQAFSHAGFEVVKTLDPACSLINTYPEPFQSGAVFDAAAAAARPTGYDLFSFFARRSVPEAAIG